MLRHSLDNRTSRTDVVALSPCWVRCRRRFRRGLKSRLTIRTTRKRVTPPARTTKQRVLTRNAPTQSWTVGEGGVTRLRVVRICSRNFSPRQQPNPLFRFLTYPGSITSNSTNYTIWGMFTIRSGASESIRRGPNLTNIVRNLAGQRRA